MSPSGLACVLSSDRHMLCRLHPAAVLKCCNWRLRCIVLLTLLPICPTDLDVQNARPKYIQNFLEELISWDVVNKRLAEA